VKERFLSGSRIFIDTNVLLYSITEHPKYGVVCDRFLDKVKAGEFNGIISVIVLNELIHKLIIGEIAEKEDLRLPQVISRIKRDPKVLEGLEAFEVVEEVESNYNLTIVGVTREDFSKARMLMVKYLLLSNDALHLAIMVKEGISDIATYDSDFDKVENIKVWRPETLLVGTRSNVAC